MRVLYHFAMSPFSKRTRLALAHKGLDAELRDGRVSPEHLAEAQRLFALGTMPVLADDTRIIGDSTTIARYLDAAYPDTAPIFPRGPATLADALQVTTLVDGVHDILVDLGGDATHLATNAEWALVKTDRMGRVARALAGLATKAARPDHTLAGDAWSAADMWLYALVAWLEAMPERAKTAPHLAAFMTLGWSVPAPLLEWRKAHEDRDDVRVVYRS